ncbi:bifunctional apoptosis regulator-like [Megalobrama amblycephala]|uniref:bifunctional apoptosis regulator-like n=1 Tax=Megalobrama amblycephala TaxID=75352 RepID=UPI0020140FE4|nr:bifunctional apoptosis regulator-like [Megalobrama amblycephala]XP_048015143.1 bifunctional apoptosis regulator-like [Megalobrama amblycephala]XP_048015144.1 bifunctional apoptosis regulator-like [Megalobrama amblycephala]
MDEWIPVDPELSESEEPMAGLSASEFTCHCCYEVLVDPTTLTCGHSFCRHCLATWWASALRTDCPECRAVWQGFPKVNILLRDVVEKLFPTDVSRRKQAVLSNLRLRHVLQAFQQQGKREAPRAAPPQNLPLFNILNRPPFNMLNPPQINIREVLAGIKIALCCVATVLLVYRAFSISSSHDVLLSKPLSRWSADDVTLWVEHLSVWTNQYKQTFFREQINGRTLSALSDEDLSATPFSIRNQSHRRIILEELHRLKERRVSLNLWQYKDLHLGKTLFLLLSLRRFPRLTLLYLFLFDYDDTFLPFIHTSCPAQTTAATQDSLTDTPLERPGWHQWAEFLLMYLLLPYQLLSAFAWHWLSVHNWTTCIVIFHALLLSVQDVYFFWTLLKRGEMRTLPVRVWHEVLAEILDSSLFVLLWPLMPTFFWNFLFYFNLYVCPFDTAVLVKQTFLQTDTQQQRI